MISLWWKCFAWFEIGITISVFVCGYVTMHQIENDYFETDKKIRELKTELSQLRKGGNRNVSLKNSETLQGIQTNLSQPDKIARSLESIGHMKDKINSSKEFLQRQEKRIIQLKNFLQDILEKNDFNSIESNFTDLLEKISNSDALHEGLEVELELLRLTTTEKFDHEELFDIYNNIEEDYNTSTQLYGEYVKRTDILNNFMLETEETAENRRTEFNTDMSNIEADLTNFYSIDSEQALEINDLNSTITAMYDEWPIKSRRKCIDLLNEGIYYRGIYRITLNSGKVYVPCEFSADGSIWTVLLRRKSGSVDFYRNWDEYRDGFGAVNDEFWLGLEQMYQISNSGSYRIRVDLMDWNNNEVYATYTSFYVENESNGYKLKATGYSGNAGNAMRIHHNMEFSAKDRGSKQNCARSFNGAWWYQECFEAHLTGLYLRGGVINNRGICWLQWKNNYYSMKEAEMRIKLN